MPRRLFSRREGREGVKGVILSTIYSSFKAMGRGESRGRQFVPVVNSETPRYPLPLLLFPPTIPFTIPPTIPVTRLTRRTSQKRAR